MKVRKNITISPKAISKAIGDSKAKYGKENVSKHIEELILNYKTIKS